MSRKIMGGAEEFLEHCKEIKKIAFSFTEPLIVHHYDADGLSSGALVASAFISDNRKFRRECIKKLDDEAIDRYAKEKEIVFVDLGGGNKRVNELNDVVVIDHHQTEGIEKPQANPLLSGLDGGTELSASGTAYCVFQVKPELAVVGAVGDMQSPLQGMNRWVLEEGTKKGEVRIEEDLKFYGRYCRPLVQFLAYSDDPYLPGITYREDKAAELLAELGISLETEGVKNRRVYADLSESEKKTLISALVKILINSGRLRDGGDMIGESYVFPNRPRNETYEANEFSTLLNACGRHSQADIGVKVCLGEESAYAEARNLLQLHRKLLREGIDYAGTHLQDLGPFYFVDGRGVIDEGIIGIVCGMALQQKWTKPILGLAFGGDNSLKISGRAPKALVALGLNLGDLMKKSCESIGGVGGGHRIAAGASIPKDKVNEFLIYCGGYLKNRQN